MSAKRNIYDVVVVGVGGMGSAACWHLARRGVRVLGLERFDIPHAMGSSHGFNRIIRLGYFEDPSYVPLLRRAYENWRELETRFGEQLMFITGSVDAGPAGSRMVEGSLRACREHGLPHEALSGRELKRRAPGYELPDAHVAVLQGDGGFISAERAIVAHVSLAQAAGADIHAREPVLGWDTTASGVRVETERGTYEAGRLVVAAGSWMGDFVPGLRNVAVPERQVLGWFQPLEPELFTPERFPVFNMEVGDAKFYGFPAWHVPGFKIGRWHHLGETGQADVLSREVTLRDEAVLRECVVRCFPKANGPTMGLRACFFTNTPDEHFIIDTLPDQPQVIVASPCSGHGFKFCSVVGEVLADFVTAGRSSFDLGLHTFRRFAA